MQVEWFGDQAVKVTFEEPNGTVRNRLVYRGDEAPLELVGPGRAWSFSANGHLFRPAAEAQRIPAGAAQPLDDVVDVERESRFANRRARDRRPRAAGRRARCRARTAR